MARIKKALWEINAQIAELQNLLYECSVEDGVLVNKETGEVMPLDTLEALQTEHEEKMKNCLYVYKNYFANVEAGLEAQKALHYAEIDIINAKIEANKNSKKNFAAYMMLCTGGEKWKAEDGSYSCWTQDDKSADVIDESLIPEQYIRVKKEIDRKQILDDLKQGVKIDGAALKITKGFRVR